jgi:N6-L-threonylcarbamoyladenine synthase
MLNLPYPGGPSISNEAIKGDAKKIVFPQAYMKDESFDFSFSGIKTSVLYFLQKNKAKIENGEITVSDIAAAFQKAAVRAIVNKIRRIYKKYRIKNIAITGGVAANSYLKEEIKRLAEERNLNVFIPSPILCTDNGAMIAYAGYEYAKHNKYSELDLDIIPDLKL